jgi:hypothetical protein
MDKFDVRSSVANLARRKSEPTAEFARFDFDESEYDQCPFCSAVAVSDDMLLAFALKQLDVSKESLVEQYRAAKCKE